MQTSTHSLKHKDGAKWSVGFFISTRLISLSLLSATIETSFQRALNDSSDLATKDQKHRAIFLSFNQDLVLLCSFLLFFLLPKHGENFKYLDAIHYLMQYYKLVFKDKSEGDDAFFFLLLFTIFTSRSLKVLVNQHIYLHRIQNLWLP